MENTIFDIVIIGAGPAGIQAAIHASRRKTRVLMLGRVENSALHGAHIENYAFVGGVQQGADLLHLGIEQAKSFGTQVSEEDVLKILAPDEESNDSPSPYFRLDLESGTEVQARALIFAMGVSKQKLNIPGEKEFSGKGVSYCVDCDANFYRGATVAVTGTRSAAVDGALTLLDYASKVYLISEELSISPQLAERLRTSKVEYIKTQVKEVDGEHLVQSLQLTNGESISSDGLFIELGSKGALELATQIGVMLDSDSFKYINITPKQETNIPGVYAAGDITGPPFQMAKAVGQGCIAGMEAASFAKRQKRQEEA